MKFDVPHRGLKWLEYYSGHNVYHPGWDLNRGMGNDDHGDNVFCPVDGEVEYVSPKPSIYNRQNGGFGWFVVVYHQGYGVWTRYAHLSKVAVHKGQKVEKGQKIAQVGNTGTKYAHLHWEVFGDAMYKIQANHWRKFGYYPSGKSKAWVSDHYIDGLKWIEEINSKPTWKQDAEEWASSYVKDMDGFLSGYDPHRMIMLIKRAVEDKK